MPIWMEHISFIYHQKCIIQINFNLKPTLDQFAVNLRFFNITVL